MHAIRLKPKEDRRLIRGHLWVYRNELATDPTKLAELKEGDLAEVSSSEGRFVGRGFWQASGGIAVRILAHHQEAIDAAFFSRRVQEALAFRRQIFPGESVYRWVFAESDGLPGLVADRYGALVSIETACGFYARHAEALAEAFMRHREVTGVRMQIAGVCTRVGEIPVPVEIAIDGMRYLVDVEHGQKTGMFLDQRTNALEFARLAQGATVLDGHCCTGLWSCRAALAGAERVIGVDSSSAAIALAGENARLNGVEDRCTFVCGDIADTLAQGESYDIVLLDPPALARSRAQLAKAQGLYLALNRDAMQCVKPGGMLVSSCCSHVVTPEDYLEILKRAARAARRAAWVVSVRGAAPDHPVLLSMPETAYLTSAVLRLL